jgi:hypothetical protein
MCEKCVSVPGKPHGPRFGKGAKVQGWVQVSGWPGEGGWALWALSTASHVHTVEVQNILRSKRFADGPSSFWTFPNVCGRPINLKKMRAFFVF